MKDSARLADGPGVPGLVSVVIPTYNRAYAIGTAIESVLQQTYRPLEVVIADDGSADNTRAVVEGYGPEVRYFRQTNAGVSAARNLGLRQVRGEFVALLDSDDSWLPWKLAVQVELLRRFPDVGMVWTDMTAVDEAGRRRHQTYLRTFYRAYKQVRIEEALARGGSVGDLWPEAPTPLAGQPFYTGDLFSPMILGNLVHTSTVLLRRERLAKVGGFDESLRVSGEDYEFHLRTCFHGPVALVDAPSILYRVGAADQLTAPGFDVHIARNNLNTLLNWLERGRGRIAFPEKRLRRHLASAFTWLGEEELLLGDAASARGHLWRSLRLQPAQARTVLLLLKSLVPQAVLAGARRTRQGLRGVWDTHPRGATR